MSELPKSCPTCSTAIPDGARQCPGCRRVFGEDNRCSACNAVAAVRPKGDGYACLACGAPRVLKPGTVVIGGGAGGGAADFIPGGAAGQRGISTGLRFFGIGAIAGGILLATGAAALIPGALGFGLAAVLGLGGVGAGLGALFLGKSAASDADRRRVEMLRSRIVDLAERGEGRLTATEVSRELGISAEEADAALSVMADGEKIALEVSPEGLLFYDFRELRALRSGPLVRVGESVPAEFEVEAATEAEALKSNEH